MKIKLKDIVKIQYKEMEIFEVEDDDYFDYRIVKNKERAIYNILNKITTNIEEQETIRKTIYKNMWNTEDFTYKPICDELRRFGYEVVYD